MTMTSWGDCCLFPSDWRVGVLEGFAYLTGTLLKAWRGGMAIDKGKQAGGQTRGRVKSEGGGTKAFPAPVVFVIELRFLESRCLKTRSRISQVLC